MFRMTVEDTFFIAGRGLVATGSIESGSLRVGDEVQIDGGRSVHVEGIEKFRTILDSAAEGDNVGVLLKGVTKDDVPRGAVLSSDTGGAAPSPDVSAQHDAANRALGRD